MKKTLWFSALACGCAAFSANAQFGSGPSKLELIKLQDDLYVIHNEYVPGNTTALITNEGVILVDDKFEIDADNIVALLKTVTNQPIKYVINTHFHGDHSGGNAKLQAGGRLAVASTQARSRMVAANQSGQPDITVEPRGSIHLGGKSAEIYSVWPRAHGWRRRRAVSAESRARGRRHVHGRRGHAAAHRLHGRRQRQGMDGDGYQGARARVRYRRSRVTATS